MTFKQDMLTEAECRLSHSEEDREIAQRLADEMCALCDGVRVSVAMNVITSLLCHIYVENFKNPDLEILLANVAHNYRLRVRPESEVAQ